MHFAFILGLQLAAFGHQEVVSQYWSTIQVYFVHNKFILEWVQCIKKRGGSILLKNRRTNCANKQRTDKSKWAYYKIILRMASLKNKLVCQKMRTNKPQSLLCSFDLDEQTSKGKQGSSFALIKSKTRSKDLKWGELKIYRIPFSPKLLFII